MSNLAVYPGTFDPITHGHIDLIVRASKIFKQIVVAVAVNSNKKPLFSLEERIALAQASLQAYSNVKVVGFSGLLIEFVKQQQAVAILRGLRTMTDFDYECQLASMNHTLDSNLETVFLVPSEKYRPIASSLVREIAMLGGDVSAFVPAPVVKALAEKYKR